MGFKSVFLNGKYVEHLGDNCSRQAGKRPNDGTTPEDHFPQELKQNRTYPVFDYLQWDKHWRHPNDITIVTAMLNIDREDRNFQNHYMKGVEQILKSRHPVVMYCDEQYFDQVRQMRGDAPITLIDFKTQDLERTKVFERIQSIIQTDEWLDQSPWMKDSVIGSRYYIPLTLYKHSLLTQALSYYNSSYYYWIDAGIYNSYNIDRDINNFYFTKIPKDKFFMTAFGYYSDTEIHGFNIHNMEDICGEKPNHVCRASLFGGTKEQVIEVGKKFEDVLDTSLDLGCVGAEEALYTILSIKHPDLFHIRHMPTGDVYRNFIATLT